MPNGQLLGNVTGAGFSVYPQRDEIMLNEKYFPRDEYFSHLDGASALTGDGDDVFQPGPAPQLKHPNLQVRGLSYDKPVANGSRLHLLDDISFEARAGEILGVLATSGKYIPISISLA